MQCHKPTSCGHPDVSQYAEYITFAILYLVFTIAIIKRAHRTTSMFQACTGKTLLFIILIQCLLRMLLCADLQINMPSSLFFFLQRLVLIPFGVATVLLTLSWTRLWFYLKYPSKYEQKLQCFQILSFVLLGLTTFFGLSFGYIVASLFWAFIGCAILYLYLSVLYFISVFQVFYALNSNYPLFSEMYGTSLRINAFVVSFCILSRVILYLYMGLFVEELRAPKDRQIIDGVMVLVCEVIPLFFMFIRMHFQFVQNESFKATVIESFRASSNRHNSSYFFVHQKNEESVSFHMNLTTTITTKPNTVDWV